MGSANVFEKSVQEAHLWLKDICSYSSLDTEDKALIALRIVLQELRDNLTLKNAAKLSAEFPILIKGIFFENWSPENWTPRDNFRKEKENYMFKDAIAEKLKKFPGIDPEKAIVSVFNIIGRHIGSKEVEKMRKILPSGILAYWFEATESK